MKNLEIVRILREISFLLQIIEDEPTTMFKVMAYEKVADVIENISMKIEKIYHEKGIAGLIEIPSIGSAIALKIEEFINSGKIGYHEELKKKIPVKISEFLNVEGLGPKTIRILYEKLKITSISELEKATKEGRIANLKGFSKKREENILKKIQLSKKIKNRYLLGDVYPMIKEIERKLINQESVISCAVVGSFRRMSETIGDVDLLLSSKYSGSIIDFFVNMPDVEEIISRGKTKTSVKLSNGMRVDLLVVAQESFGSALQYFTGSKDHNISLRNLAISRGFHLNEWGLYASDKKKIAGKNEKEIYGNLGISFIPPELRENKGEIEFFSQKEIRNLVEYTDLKGDLQVHTDSTDGTMSIKDMALYAREKFGLDYLAITDHTKSLRLANGLDENQLLDQISKIQEINDIIRSDSNKNKYFRILSSAEVNILKDGTLDISNNLLDKLDVVGAAIHQNFLLPEDLQTERIIKAAKNPSVDILFHPTGRIINKREGYSIDIKKIIDIAYDTKTVLEINANYHRLDLKDEYIRMSVQNGIKLVVNSDAHHPVHFSYLVFGIGQARRGWAKKSDILNTLPVDLFLKKLK